MATFFPIRLFHLFKSHILFMYATIDPLMAKSLEGENSQRLKFSRQKHALTSLSVVLLATLIGVYGFQLEAGMPLNSAFLANSSVLFSHQLVPRPIWPQIDFALAIDIAATVAILVVFSVDRPIGQRYRLFKCTSQSSIYLGQTVILTGADFTQIVKFPEPMEGLGTACNDRLYDQCSLTNGVYSTSPTSIIYWVFIFPTNIFYYCSSILGSVIYTLLTSNYIVIWQKAIYKKTTNKMAHFEKKFNKVENRKNNQTDHYQFIDEQARFQSLLYFRSFLAQNGRWNELCSALSAYSRLCQPLLSTIFPFIITIQCYLLYIILLLPSASIPPSFKYVCLLTITEFNLFLLVVTNQCARVVTFNRRFHKLNRKFYDSLQQNNALHGIYVLKAELLQDHGRFGPFGFRLVGDYRITNRTFNAVLTYISIFFMFLVKDAYKNRHHI
ncbi:hypothetical protein TYRP_015364 [Tyrophagus putrescentiae]|nr:hypothetical protein TYRP_015364 [Tyrophagus putrescentiae]